jgi:hypothetical protein
LRTKQAAQQNNSVTEDTLTSIRMK